MGNGPWSIKGIDPRAREAAKAAAQREGVTIGELLNRQLMQISTQSSGHKAPNQGRFTGPGSFSISADDRPGLADNDQDVRQAIIDLTSRLEDSERHSTLAITRIDQSVLALLNRLESLEKDNEHAGEQLEESLHSISVQLARTTDDIAAMTAKQDRSVEDLARRLDTVAERSQLQASRTQHELSKELELLNTRSDEQSQRLAKAEKLTDNAVRTLEASFAAIDDRLRQVEARLDANNGENLSETFSNKFKVLSDELVHVVAQTRGQLAAKIEAQANTPRLDQLENALANVRSTMADAERRHADTLERIATEVGKLGQAVDRRFIESERSAAVGVDQMLEARFREFQSEHAAAIDRIGDGVTGAVERLEEKLNAVEERREKEDSLDARIAASEERTASLIEQAMSSINERLERQDEDSDSPVLKALAALDARLEAIEGSAVTPPFDDAEPPHISQPAAATDWTSEQSPGEPNFGEEAITPQDTGPFAPDETVPPALPPLPAVDVNQADDGDEPFSYDTAAPDILAGGFGLSTDAPDSPPNAFTDPGQMSDHAQPAEPVPAAPLAGAAADHSFINNARAALRTPAPHTAQTQAQPDQAHNGSFLHSRKLLVAGSAVALLAITGAAGLALFDNGIFGNKSPQDNTKIAQGEWDTLLDGQDEKPVRTAAVTTANADENNDDRSPVLEGAPQETRNVARTETTDAKPANTPTTPVAYPGKVADKRQKSAVTEASNRPPTHGKTTTSFNAPAAQPVIPVQSHIIASATPTPTPIPTAQINARPTVEQAAKSGNPIAQYQLASARLDAGDVAGGAVLMKQAAERGLPIAQYRLAKLYEEGTGVPKDAAQTRRWTERAANGGNRRAMHNLAMIYAEGAAVEQSYETAARWFQEAARLGLTNSQYNLAFLYEEGLGVPQSKKDAYIWYTIAAKSGNDEAAAKKAKAILVTLDAAAKKQAQATIAAYQPRPLDPEANGVFQNLAWARPQLNAAPSVARAQVLLARIGYKPGPADGKINARTTKAIIAYERDNGLAQTGHIDASLMARLERDALN